VDDLSLNSKYQDIFRTAKELFWKYGIRRVSIEEICKEAGVSKMTFYKFFPNKIELAKTILKVNVGKSLEKFEKVVVGDLSFNEKIKEMLLIKLEGTKDISIEFVSDIYKIPDTELQQIVQKQAERSLEIFVGFLKDSQKSGLIRKEIKIDFILYYFNQMNHILDDKDLVSKYDHPQDLIMESMNFLFYGLLPRK
jgi:AcrR family transcriptional regulator